MRKYRLVARKGEGTFSEVLKAQNIKDGKFHAIKCMKNKFDSIDQVNNLREIQALRRLSPHEHVITLEEVLYDQPTGRLALVFELMDGNLYEIIRGRRHYLNPQLIKGYMWQLMKSLDHMHKKGIFHRDIKPENILVEANSEFGRGLKLADFGSCRGIYSKQPYTEYISTRWYRAPECLLTDGYYGPEMDLWGAGCVMYEITTLQPLFPGENEADQIARIHKIMGTKTETLEKLKAKGAAHVSFDFPFEKGTGISSQLQHAAPDAVDLIHKMLRYDAAERITARDAMKHPYFKDIREFELKKQQQLQQQQQQNASGNGSVVSGVVTGAPSTVLSPEPPVAVTVTKVKPAPVAKQISNVSDNGNGQQTLLQQQIAQQQAQQQQYAAQQYANQQQKSSTLAPIPNTNKALPNIGYNNAATVAVTDSSMNNQARNYPTQVPKHYQTTPANVNPLLLNPNNSVVVNALPPIGGNSNVNNNQLSKEVNKILVRAGNPNNAVIQNTTTTTTSNAVATNNYNPNNYNPNNYNPNNSNAVQSGNNPHRARRVRYRLNYAPQDNKADQNRQVLKTYGVNK